MNPAVFATATATSACSLGPQGSGSGDHGPDRIARTFYDAAGQVTEVRTALGTADEASAIREKGATSGIAVLATIAYDQLGRRTGLTARQRMNMMRPLYLLLVSAVSLGSLDSAVARPATAVGHDWCEIGLNEGGHDWTPLAAPLAVVSVDGLAEAMRLLENRTILPIASRTAKRLAGRVPPGTGKLYLARSGIFAQPGATPTQYLLRAWNVSFRQTLWDSENRVLITYTSQMQDTREDIFPAPLIVRLSVAPLRVRSFCDSYY